MTGKKTRVQPCPACGHSKSKLDRYHTDVRSCVRCEMSCFARDWNRISMGMKAINVIRKLRCLEKERQIYASRFWATSDPSSIYWRAWEGQCEAEILLIKTRLRRELFIYVEDGK